MNPEQIARYLSNIGPNLECAAVFQEGRWMGRVTLWTIQNIPINTWYFDNPELVHNERQALGYALALAKRLAGDT